MWSQSNKIIFWALFLVLYISLVPLILSKIDIQILPILWVIGLIAVFIILFVQIRKVDKIIDKDKEFKKQVSKNLKEYLKIYTLTEMSVFLVFVAYLLVLKFFNIDISILQIIIGVVITIFFFWALRNVE